MSADFTPPQWGNAQGWQGKKSNIESLFTGWHNNNIVITEYIQGICKMKDCIEIF